MSKITFESISTGGGCVGYYAKYKNFTFYLTTMHESTLPKNKKTVALGIYDKDFDNQLASDTIKNFDASQMDLYIKKSLEKYLKIKKTKKHNGYNDIFYLD